MLHSLCTCFTNFYTTSTYFTTILLTHFKYILNKDRICLQIVYEDFTQILHREHKLYTDFTHMLLNEDAYFQNIRQKILLVLRRLWQILENFLYVSLHVLHCEHKFRKDFAAFLHREIDFTKKMFRDILHR